MIASHPEPPDWKSAGPRSWPPELMTGNTRIDHQHIKIFETMSTLLDALAEGKEQEEVSKVLTTLSIFVVAHFQMEDALMVQFGYSGLNQHRQAHEIVRAIVEKMVDRFHNNNLNPLELVSFMDWWLNDHVQKEDLNLARFLISTTVASATTITSAVHIPD